MKSTEGSQQAHHTRSEPSNIVLAKSGIAIVTNHAWCQGRAKGACLQWGQLVDNDAQLLALADELFQVVQIRALILTGAHFQCELVPCSRRRIREHNQSSASYKTIEVLSKH